MLCTLTYIFHSCFLLETERFAAVFDFWRDPSATEGEEPLFLRNLPQDKPLYVLASHHHKDHYTKEIFSWDTIHPRIRYILSRDTAKMARHILRPESIYAGHKADPAKVTVLRPGESFADSDLSVKAFGSTDTGNSYLLEAEGKTIFHAGDLNAWIWLEESTKAEVAAAVRDYSRVLNDIAGATQRLDIAMFPVDSRIGPEWYTGARMLVERFDVGRFFPMHFELGDTPAQLARRRMDACRFSLYANRQRGEYIALQAPGAEWFGRI